MWPVLVSRIETAARVVVLVICAAILVALVIKRGNPNNWCKPWCYLTPSDGSRAPRASGAPLDSRIS